MTNVTPTLSSILVNTYKADAISTEVSFRTLDNFLIEAKQINQSIRDLISYVRAIRAPYLSTVPPPRRNQKHAQTQAPIKTSIGEVPHYINDGQREEIDAQTTALLNDINGKIMNLRNACNIRHETVQLRLERKYGKSTNFLLRWAAGGEDADVGDAGKTEQRIVEEGQERTTTDFQEGVVWYLNWGYQNAMRALYEMLDKRLERQREKAASILYDERNRNVKQLSRFDDDGLTDTNLDMRGRDTYNPLMDVSRDGAGQELSPEQLQLFEEENSSLMQHYNETLTQVTQVEKSMHEISSLQQTLVGHLTVQGEMIDNLVSDADRTDENVQRGNKELKRATERTSTAKVMYHTTLWLCAGLIVWDMIF